MKSEYSPTFCVRPLMRFGCFSVMSQSMIGHCLGAAGGLEAIATIKAIETGWLHPSINQFVSSFLRDNFWSCVNRRVISSEKFVHDSFEGLVVF